MTDSQDRVYVFNRGEDPVLVFEAGGRLLHSWGQALFRRPHGIYIDPDDCIYCTDDLDHTGRKFTLDGQLILTLDVSGQASDTGVIGADYRNIRRAGLRFHRPTNVAIASDGTWFVSGGYVNACIRRLVRKPCH